jgi:hypothetical protein
MALKNELPNFIPYDKVQFELDPKLKHPRWYLNIDRGYSGVYAKGYILSISDYAIHVVGYLGDQIIEATFPNYESSDYEPGQWDYPGYLSLQDNIPDCDCGHGNKSNLHWQFCSRGKHINR